MRNCFSHSNISTIFSHDILGCMRESIPTQSQQTKEKEDINNPYTSLRQELAGQGGFFDKLACEKGLPRELLVGEWPRPSSILTAKGSVYRYLPDGRTQRFKQATKEMNEPQDVLVFIPPWDLIAEKAKKMYPELLGGIENDLIFQDILLEFAQLEGRNIRIADENGTQLRTNEAVQKAKQAYMQCIDRKAPEKSFDIPVGKRPAIGWNTLDTRFYKGPDGRAMQERHIGNAVVKVNFDATV